MEETEAGIDGGEAQGMEDERLLEWSWTGEFFFYNNHFLLFLLLQTPLIFF